MSDEETARQVKRERETEQEVRAMDTADVVERIHALEDEIAALEARIDIGHRVADHAAAAAALLDAEPTNLTRELLASDIRNAVAAFRGHQ